MPVKVLRNSEVKSSEPGAARQVSRVYRFTFHHPHPVYGVQYEHPFVIPVRYTG